MQVTYKKHINVDNNNRVEFLLINWDYVDGGDYLAKIFARSLGCQQKKRSIIYFLV